MKFLWAALGALALAGCGYHAGGGAAMMPKDVKTIAIPAFSNGTTNHALATRLPAEISREFLSRTRYGVTANPDQADAVLSGALVNFAAYPTVSDPNTGRATAVQVVVTVNVTLRDRRTGAVLFVRNGAEFRERYEISLDPKAYFDESGTAIERISGDVARTVVSAVLENF